MNTTPINFVEGTGLAGLDAIDPLGFKIREEKAAEEDTQDIKDMQKKKNEEG